MKHILLLILLFSAALPLAAIHYGTGVDIEPPASAMVMGNQMLYMTFCGKKKMVAAIELSNPRAPKLLAAYHTGFFPQGLALQKEKGRLFVADGRFLTILRISDRKKLTLLMRFLISNDCTGGPVDVAIGGNRLLLACRKNGIMQFNENAGQTISTHPGWARSITAEEKNSAVFHNAVLSSGGRNIPVPFGTPRKIRTLPDGRLCLANGFSGIAVIGTDGKIDLTENLGRFSCYGAHVYDIAPGWTDADGKTQTVFLAAGEIGVITAEIGNGIQLAAVCTPLKWKNVNGIVRGQGNLVYVSDETFGLHVLEIQPDGKTLKLVNSLKLSD